MICCVKSTCRQKKNHVQVRFGDVAIRREIRRRRTRWRRCSEGVVGTIHQGCTSWQASAVYRAAHHPPWWIYANLPTPERRKAWLVQMRGWWQTEKLLASKLFLLSSLEESSMKPWGSRDVFDPSANPELNKQEDHLAIINLPIKGLTKVKYTPTLCLY